MQTVWTKGYKDKEARKKEILAYRNAFDALKEVLEKEYVPAPPSDYENPAWAYKQAHINGQNQMLERVMSLITVKEN